MSINNPESQQTKYPHSGGSQVPEEMRERVVDENITPISKDLLHANTDGITIIPSTLREGFESFPPTPAEKATYDQDSASVANRYNQSSVSYKAEENELDSTNKFVSFLKTRTGKITAALAGIALVGGSVGVASSLSGEHKDSISEPNPTASAPVTPGPEVTEKVTTKADVVKSLEVSSGQSNEELTRSFVSLISKWDMAGSDKATAHDMIVNKGYTAQDTAKYAQEIAEAEAPIYAEAAFGPNWKQNKNIVDYVKVATDSNAETLALRVITSTESTPFTVSLHLDEFTLKTQSGTTKEFVMDTSYVTNDSQNKAGRLIQQSGGTSINGSKETVTIITAPEGDKEYIKNITLSAK